MQIAAATPGQLGHQDPDAVVSPLARLAEVSEGALETTPLPEADLVEKYVQRILREKLWAMIAGADEEESGIPPLDYEL